MALKSGLKLVPKDKMLLVILIIVIINTILIGFGYFLLAERYAGRDTTLAYRQELALDLADYNHRLASELGVSGVASVREALAEYNYAVDMAADSDELIQIIFSKGRMAQEIIFLESDARLKERVLVLVNNDIRVKENRDKKHLFIRIAESEINIYPDQFLETNTVQLINNLFLTDRYHNNQNIDIEIEGGVAVLVVPQTEEEQMRALNEDLNSMRLRLHEVRMQSGLAEMVGPGITLYVYDAVENDGTGSLVHDADIRDIVNELYSAGAKGVAVGGQRLTTVSSIRCTGPLVMVNFRQVPSNPVVIEAIGSPELLISGLSIIISDMEKRRGLVFEISDSGFIKLPAYASFE
jgi:hypothetical protein